jgi:transposase-like protein
MAETLRVAADAGSLGAATVNEIAKELGVVASTIYLWIKEHQDFSEAFAYARQMADRKIESALFKRAHGYELNEVRKTVKDGPKGVEVVEHTQVNHIPPDTAAAVFWLKNRNPADWSDKTKVEVTGDFADKVEAILKAKQGQA